MRSQWMAATKAGEAKAVTIYSSVPTTGKRTYTRIKYGRLTFDQTIKAAAQ